MCRICLCLCRARPGPSHPDGDRGGQKTCGQVDGTSPLLCTCVCLLREPFLGQYWSLAMVGSDIEIVSDLQFYHRPVTVGYEDIMAKMGSNETVTLIDMKGSRAIRFFYINQLSARQQI